MNYAVITQTNISSPDGPTIPPGIRGYICANKDNPEMYDFWPLYHEDMKYSHSHYFVGVKVSFGIEYAPSYRAENGKYYTVGGFTVENVDGFDRFGLPTWARAFKGLEEAYPKN